MGYLQNPTPTAPELDRDILMKQYQLMVDTYLKYLDITLKFTLFSYAVTGAILSYYLSKPAEGFMKYGLVFPIVVNAVFGLSCFVAANWNRSIFGELERVTLLLNLGAFPDSRFLTYVLVALGALFALITIGLTGISFYRTFL
jgi:hypothetical protein